MAQFSDDFTVGAAQRFRVDLVLGDNVTIDTIAAARTVQVPFILQDAAVAVGTGSLVIGEFIQISGYPV